MHVATPNAAPPNPAPRNIATPNTAPRNIATPNTAPPNSAPRNTVPWNTAQDGSVFCYSPFGFEGSMVKVEVDVRPGLPGTEIIGLPNLSVKESRDRARSAIRNAGLEYPTGRVLINLAPAGVPKHGAAYDLAIACAILLRTGQLGEGFAGSLVVLGELQLSGFVSPVGGLVSAMLTAIEHGVTVFVVASANMPEAASIGRGIVIGVNHLHELIWAMAELRVAARAERRSFQRIERRDGFVAGNQPALRNRAVSSEREFEDLDFGDVRGLEFAKRAMVVAAAGRHHVLLFGPPGTGKTMMAVRLPGVMADLSDDAMVEVARVYSNAGLLSGRPVFSRKAPMRLPHHSASVEGMVGGAKTMRPGELSLSHHGVLVLDEAPEFKKNVLQALREPVETGRVNICRVDGVMVHPARFLLVMTMNPCPCGRMGGRDRGCVCNQLDVQRYWARIGAPLLDRVDIRLPVGPEQTGPVEAGTRADCRDADKPPESWEQPLTTVRMRNVVTRAVAQQVRRSQRLFGSGALLNGDLTPAQLRVAWQPAEGVESMLETTLRRLSISHRGRDSVMAVSRTIADAADAAEVAADHVLEAVAYRRFGDGDFFWMQQ